MLVDYKLVIIKNLNGYYVVKVKYSYRIKDVDDNLINKETITTVGKITFEQDKRIYKLNLNSKIEFFNSLDDIEKYLSNIYVDNIAYQ